MPFSISRSGAGACTTSPAHAWQAYVGRRVTITLNCAGMTSSRFRDVLADPVLEAAAARAGLVRYIDDDLFARQMRRQRAAIDPPPARRDWLASRAVVLRRDVCRRERLLDILQRQRELLGIELLGTAAKAVPLQLSNDCCQPLEAQLAAVSGKATIAGAIRYTLSRWDGLTRFLDDGRIEIDSNVVERAIRPIALGRKNHLFAGSDGGGEHWAVIASLIETCKMNGVDPQAYLRDVLARIVARHPMGRIDELLPFAYISAADKAAA